MQTPTEEELQTAAKQLVSRLTELLNKLKSPRSTQKSLDYARGYREGMEEMKRRLLGR